MGELMRSSCPTPASMGWERSTLSASGLAFFQANGAFSWGSDSGRTNKPQQHWQGHEGRGPEGQPRRDFLRIPPTQDETDPKATPMSLKLAARFSGGVTSEIYAPAVLKLPQ